MEVEGSRSYGEYDDQWHAVVTYRCPWCGTRHRQSVKGKGKTPEKIPTQCKKGLGAVEVRPYQHN